MKILIDVSDTLYETCKRLVSEGDPRPSESCIANGIPLPKGHGRLVDENHVIAQLVYRKHLLADNVTCGEIAEIFDNAAIVEADESEEEKMITTLDDAIAHAREVAETWKSQLVNCISEEGRNKCLECAKDHEQLAEWLEQLQAIKLLYKEYERFGGGFHYQVGRVFDGDYVLDNKESEKENAAIR